MWISFVFVLLVVILFVVDFVVFVFVLVDVVDYVYFGGWEYFVGGGIVVFDCFGDVLFEFYVVGGVIFVILFLNMLVDDVVFMLRILDVFVL